jgi:hypothetical protein
MGRESEATKRSWKQWKPAQARKVLEAWRSSGLSLSAYAQRRGVTPQRLSWWRERLGEGSEPEPSEMRLVPAIVTSMPAPMPALCGAVTVRLPGDVTLEVSDVRLVPPDWVAAVAWKLSRAE